MNIYNINLFFSLEKYNIYVYIRINILYTYRNTQLGYQVCHWNIKPDSSQYLKCNLTSINANYITLRRLSNTLKIIDRANEPRVRYKRIIWRWSLGAGVRLQRPASCLPARCTEWGAATSRLASLASDPLLPSTGLATAAITAGGASARYDLKGMTQESNRIKSRISSNVLRNNQ